MKWLKCEDPEHCSDEGIWHVGEDDCPTGGPHSVSPSVDCLCGATWAELYSRLAAHDRPAHWPQEPLTREPAPEPGVQLGLSCCRTHLAGYRCSCSNPARLDNPKPDPYRGGLRDAPPRLERKC